MLRPNRKNRAEPDDDDQNEEPNKKKKMKEPEVVYYDGSEVNPFLLNPVLEIMTKLMSIEDLKVARQLCQSWDQQCMKEMSTIPGQLKTLNMWDDSKVHEFTTKMDLSQYKKVLSPNISYCVQFRPSSKTHSQTLEKYFTDFGPQNVELTLTNACDQELHQVLQISSNFLKKLDFNGTINESCLQNCSQSVVVYPELEELSIVLVVNCEGRQLFDIFCSEIALKSPKLKCLKLQNNCATVELEPMSSELLKSSSILNLDQLHLSNNYYTCSPEDDVENTLYLGPNELTQLTLNGLKLSHFSNTIYFVAHSEETVRNYYDKLNHFLNGQSGNLKNLELSLGSVFVLKYPAIKCQFTLPPLRDLKVLKLGNYQYVDFNPYKKINLSLFGQLKEIIFEMNTSNWDQIFEGVCSSVVKVTIIYSSRLYSKTNYAQLVNFLPNVKFLCIVATSATKPILEKIKNNLKTLPWTMCLEKLSLKMPALYLSLIDFDKSIGHLKGLKKLELIDEIAKTQNDNYINLQSLQESPIKHMRIKNFKLSDENIKELRQKFVLDYAFSYVYNQVYFPPSTP